MCLTISPGTGPVTINIPAGESVRVEVGSAQGFGNGATREDASSQDLSSRISRLESLIAKLESILDRHSSSTQSTRSFDDRVDTLEKKVKKLTKECGQGNFEKYRCPSPATNDAWPEFYNPPEDEEDLDDFDLAKIRSILKSLKEELEQIKQMQKSPASASPASTSIVSQDRTSADKAHVKAQDALKQANKTVELANQEGASPGLKDAIQKTADKAGEVVAINNKDKAQTPNEQINLLKASEKAPAQNGDETPSNTPQAENINTINEANAYLKQDKTLKILDAASDLGLYGHLGPQDGNPDSWSGFAYLKDAPDDDPKWNVIENAIGFTGENAITGDERACIRKISQIFTESNIAGRLGDASSDFNPSANTESNERAGLNARYWIGTERRMLIGQNIKNHGDDWIAGQLGIKGDSRPLEDKINWLS